MAELFVKQASTYAKIRPQYPASLFQMLASSTQRHERAWDVGTGNGQAATTLAEHYKTVVATDVSEKQLSHAMPHPNVTYATMAAVPSSPEEVERIVGAEGSVDLVTVAQAVHWFDLEKFYPIVKKVLRKPGGVIAVWCYGMPTVDPKVDELSNTLNESVMPYWAPQIKFVAEEYRNLPFPFEALPDSNGRSGLGPFRVDLRKQWTMADFVCFFESFSSVITARDQGVEVLHQGWRKALSDAWVPAHQAREVIFPMHLLLGTVGSRETS